MKRNIIINEQARHQAKKHIHSEKEQRTKNKRKINASYLVLQGLPTTITFTLRDATALRAFPYNI